MESDVLVTIGVDTHADFHVGVALDQRGGLLGELTLANDEGGYRRLLRWARGFGELAGVGAESTGSYGAGLSQFLRSEGVRVLEVNRVSRQHRRRHGKHDAGDAEAAARAVLSGEATGEPKAADGHVEMLRALKIARRSAVKAKTQAANQLYALVSTAPERLKADLRKLAAPRLAQKALGWDPTPAATLSVVAGDNPESLKSEAAFANLCGAAPIPASSGKVVRHRLNPHGNREANRALHVVALNRLRRDPRTPGIRRQAHRRGQEQARDHPLFEAFHSPGGLPSAARLPGSRVEATEPNLFCLTLLRIGDSTLLTQIGAS